MRSLVTSGEVAEMGGFYPSMCASSSEDWGNGDLRHDLLNSVWSLMAWFIHRLAQP